MEQDEEELLDRIPPPPKRFWRNEPDQEPVSAGRGEPSQGFGPLTPSPARIVSVEETTNPIPKTKALVGPKGGTKVPRLPLTRERLQRIRQALLAGAYLETAALWAGLQPAVFKEYLQLAAAGHPKYVKLRRILTKAMAESELSDLKTIADYSMGFPSVTTRAVTIKRADGSIETRTESTTSQVRDWKAAAFRLTHRHRERWAARTEVAPVFPGMSEARDIEIPENGRDDGTYTSYQDVALPESDGDEYDGDQEAEGEGDGIESESAEE
jgi:hypothetical protein